MPEQVLIIDDEIAIAKALSIRLMASGYITLMANNGSSGLQLAIEHQPDVILLDIRMPDIDGFEVCKRIKATHEIANTPVIFISANVKEQAVKLAYDAGATSFISKPFTTEDVLNNITEALQSA